MNALRYEEARRLIDLQVTPVTDHESVALVDAPGRTLVADLVSTVDVPAHDSAAMDGYALAASGAPASTRLRTVGQAHAGHPFPHRVEAGQCVRIMTGAVMPVGCDAVVPWEEVDTSGDEVVLKRDATIGLHRRSAGENLKAGDIAVPRGRRITASDLGLAASLGVSRLTVVRKLRVAVFSTGNELRDADRPLDAGSIRDTNRYTLIGMLKSAAVDIVDLGIVRDDPVALETAIARACADRADAIITSGGVSAGDADHTRATMERLGDVAFWKLAVKPGRPMAFGRVTSEGRSALFFALPGNPVAVMVSFHALVREALAKLAGATREAMVALTATCDVALPKIAGRTEFVRGIAFATGQGWHVRPTGDQGSAILRSMSEANCLIVLPHDRGPVAIGETIEAWPFQGLL